MKEGKWNQLNLVTFRPKFRPIFCFISFIIIEKYQLEIVETGYFNIVERLFSSFLSSRRENETKNGC